MFTLERRQEVERTIVRATIEEAIKQGWTVKSVDNGEDRTRVDSVDKAMAEAFACDEAHIYLARGGRVGWVYIVLGNEGWTVVSDYTMSLDDVVTATEALVNKFEEEAWS